MGGENHLTNLFQEIKLLKSYNVEIQILSMLASTTVYPSKTQLKNNAGEMKAGWHSSCQHILSHNNQIKLRNDNT